jgi:(2Fe-2S) ferredoxin
MMVFPDNVWLSGVTDADLEGLVDRLIADLEGETA